MNEKPTSPPLCLWLAGSVTCVALVLLAGLLGNGWFITPGLVIVPALGWFWKRRGWF